MERIVILGGGFAGLTLASELDGLAASRAADVTLLDRNAGFQMGLAFEWVLAGRREPDEGRRSYARLRAEHVAFLQEEVVGIDVSSRVVLTRSRRLAYDDLVIALGAETRPDLLPGLAEAAYNLCAMDSVVGLRDAVNEIDRGDVLVAVTALPFKCPPAPYEYALLIDDVLRERGVRDRVRLRMTTPEPLPMPVAGKAVGEAVRDLLSDRGIVYRPNAKPVSVDPRGRRMTFEDGSQVAYDILAAMPPHRAPKVVIDSGLADPSGFAPVKLGTFETEAPGVYAVGDVAALKLPDGRPHPKAGVFAEAQALVVARAIAAKLGAGPPTPYAGRGVCFVDAGRGTAAPAEVDLLAPGGPRASMGVPSADGLEAKLRFEKERLDRWFSG